MLDPLAKQLLAQGPAETFAEASLKTPPRASRGLDDVLDAVSNMSPKLMAERMEAFMRGLAERRPSVPILLTANVWVMGGEARRRDAFVRDLVARLKAEDPAKWALLHIAGDDASALAPDADGTVDGIHLNDLGMKRAGEYFGGVIRDILDL